MAEITLKSGEVRQIEMEALPKVNETKRFFRVFFKRKVVIFGAAIVVLTILMAIFANLIAPYGSNEQDLTAVLQAPSADHWLGTDSLGRDLLSRVIYGSRVALIVGVGTVAISAIIGTIIGLFAGYVGGKTQTVIMRIIDAVMALPPTLLALMIAVVLGTGVKSVMIAISVSLLPGYVRLVCGQVMSVKQNDYVMAEKSMGATKKRIMFRHILPNCISPLIVQMTMLMGLAIMTEATLSFLNMGIVPPTPAWGSLCYDGYKYLMMRPLLSIAPGLAIMLLVFSFNMVGDGLRDALDPKLRGTM
jgi:peptide/nickel transport system permease protein